MPVLALATFPNAREAEKTAKKLLEKRLVACANIIPGIKSLYLWKGKVEKGNEALLLLKTTQKNRGKVVRAIENGHQYEVPCIEFAETRPNTKCKKWLLGETE